MPLSAGFCPNCGTQIGDAGFTASTEVDTPETLLPSATGGSLRPEPGATAVPQPDDAFTIAPSAIKTSLESPSPRPVRPGDGPFQPGQQVGPRYTILKLLGAGGMGAVYQAFDHELGVAVAIKVIRPAAQSDATAAKELEVRFKRELVLARQVTHKYVVRIHDLGEIDGIKYLTMPFVEGETLANLLRHQGRLPLARAIRIAQQVAQGLAAAHEKGVIHRDLKPENIMIEAPSPVASAAQGGAERSEGGGDALIMDFGIARSVEGGGTQTAAGSVIGTLEYMAPEQAQGRKVDQRCDQYAFGLIVYDMLVGRQRLQGRENAMAELLARMAALPPSPRSLDPAIPEPVSDLVMKCLQPSPDGRFASTQELVRVLDRLTPEGHVRSDLHEVIVHDGGRPWWQLAAAAVVIVALAGTGGWLVSNRTGSGATAATAAREPISVLVADFQNKTGDPVFDGVVEQAVSLGIEGASFITAFPRRDALRALAVINPGGRLDETNARLVAQREGINTVVTGSIEPRDGGRYAISIRGVGPGNDGQVLYTLEDDADGKPQVLATVGELAGLVRKALGDTAVPAPNDAFTAASIEAASAFVQAQELQAAGRREEAITKYQEAIGLDKEFGRAYSGIAAQLESLGRREEAERYYQEALARLDRMNDREKYRTRGIYYMFARKPAQAIEELTALIKAYPYDSTGLGNLALARFYTRDLAQALEIGRQASALQPKNVGRRTNVAMYATYAGQYEAALTESAAAFELNPSALKGFVAKALSELALGRPADSIKTWEALARTSADGASWAAAGLADLAAFEGRYTDAIGILDASITSDEAAKSTLRAARKRITRGALRIAAGDIPAGVRDVQGALAMTSDNDARSAAGFVLGRAGRREEVEKIAASLDQRLEPDYQAYGKLIRAELALAQKQPRLAVDLVREAEKLVDMWIGHVILGRAYLDLEAYPDAYSQFEIAEKRQGEAIAIFMDDIPTFRYYPPVHYYKGRAQEGIRSPAAAQSYKAFLGLLRNADSPMAADARARLAKLGS